MTNPATTIDSIKRSLVSLRMPRAFEVLDAAFRQIEEGDTEGIGALDQILLVELTPRETRRAKTALMMARLTAIKTLKGFDFAFQPSLDRGRIIALAELKFIDRAEVVHLLEPPVNGKNHLATALTVEAVKAGRSVVFVSSAGIGRRAARALQETLFGGRMLPSPRRIPAEAGSAAVSDWRPAIRGRRHDGPRQFPARSTMIVKYTCATAIIGIRRPGSAVAGPRLAGRRAAKLSAGSGPAHQAV